MTISDFWSSQVSVYQAKSLGIESYDSEKAILIFQNWRDEEEKEAISEQTGFLGYRRRRECSVFFQLQSGFLTERAESAKKKKDLPFSV